MCISSTGVNIFNVFISMRLINRFSWVTPLIYSDVETLDQEHLIPIDDQVSADIAAPKLVR